MHMNSVVDRHFSSLEFAFLYTGASGKKMPLKKSHFACLEPI
jgi:hypothetical protein